MDILCCAWERTKACVVQITSGGDYSKHLLDIGVFTVIVYVLVSLPKFSTRSIAESRKASANIRVGADEGMIVATFYSKVGEKDRKDCLHFYSLAFAKGLDKRGRRYIQAPGKPIIKVK